MAGLHFGKIIAGEAWLSLRAKRGCHCERSVATSCLQIIKLNYNAYLPFHNDPPLAHPLVDDSNWDCRVLPEEKTDGTCLPDQCHLLVKHHHHSLVTKGNGW